MKRLPNGPDHELRFVIPLTASCVLYKETSTHIEVGKAWRDIERCARLLFDRHPYGHSGECVALSCKRHGSQEVARYTRQDLGMLHPDALRRPFNPYF